MKKLLSASALLIGLTWLCWFICFHKDISEKVVHDGFGARLVKVVFEGQQKVVELDDPESLACIQRAMPKARISVDSGMSYNGKFYLDNGEVDTLIIYVLGKPPELLINVWEKISHDETGSIDYLIPDPVTYGVKYDLPPPRLKLCFDLLIDDSRTGNFTIH